MKKPGLTIKNSIKPSIGTCNPQGSMSSLSFSPYLNDLPHLKLLPGISQSKDNQQSPSNHSKAAKQLKNLLPGMSPYNNNNNTLQNVKHLSNSLFTEVAHELKSPNLDLQEKNHSAASRSKALSFFESEESSSKASQISKSNRIELNKKPSLLQNCLPKLSYKKTPEIMIKNNNLSHIASKQLNKSNIPFRKNSEPSPLTPQTPKSHKKPKKKETFYTQPLLEEPEKLRIIENHPRIRKSSFSKADRLIKDWLDISGRLTNEQAKILGSSERVQKKTVFYYINQMEEKRMPLQVFIDQKLLKRKKFVLASVIIKLANTNKPLIGDILQNIYEMFTVIRDLGSDLNDVTEAMGHMKLFIEIARKFPKHEVSVYLMKFFSKMLIFYNEYGNARNLNKTASFLAKNQGLNYLLMSLHKRMGKFYRKLKKTRIALKHFLRMLALSWYLNNEQYEFSAYDEIGLCFYYLNQIEKANYYHLKMLEGEKEPMGSIARGLGILKIKSALESKVSEDTLLNLSKESSEDEEEFLFGETKVKEYQKNDKKSQIEMNIFMKKRSERIKNESLKSQNANLTLSKVHLRDDKPMIPTLRKRESIQKRFFLGNGRELLLMDKTMVLEKKMHLISHLSRNRNLMNFCDFQSKMEEENIDMHREVFKISHNEVKQKVDSKTLEKLRVMVKKLKNNLEVCILYLETMKTRNGPEQRRTGMLLRPMK